MALLVTLLVAHASPDRAAAERSVYFSDPAADAIAQFDLEPGGALTPLQPSTVAAPDARRLAMTPGGGDLFAAAGRAVLQYDVGDDGRLTPKAPALLAIDGYAHSLAVHPDGLSVYVTDQLGGRVLAFDVSGDGGLQPKGSAGALAGDDPTGVAVSPDGLTAYVLVAGGIALFDVDQNGGLTRRADGESVSAGPLRDVALTPDGRNLYATAGSGAVFQFDVGAGGTLTPKPLPAVYVKDGAAPVGLAVDPGGSAAYVAARGWAAGGTRDVFAFEIEADGSLAPRGSVPAGTKPFELSYLSTSPDGLSLFVAGGDGHAFDVGPDGALTPALPSSVDLHDAVGVVVSPNQSPVAAFTFEQATAGAPVRFDASSAVDMDGTVVRYDWDFGDGQVALDAGPTPSHTYTAPGSYIVTLVVTDNEGASTATVFTGGTVLGHGTPGAVTTRRIEVLAPVVPVEPAQGPVPDLGETLVAEPESGSVRVRVRGAKRFKPLASIRELPLGSTLDARHGRVAVSTIRDRRNRVQQGVFHAGVFTVRQRETKRFVTELVLRGKVGPCAKAGGSAHSSARSRRRLWGSGRGRYRSRGNNSSATVRGTIWLVEDRCDGTLTRVRRGTVVVRDFELKRKVVLERGDSYLAKAE